MKSGSTVGAVPKISRRHEARTIVHVDIIPWDACGTARVQFFSFLIENTLTMGG